MGCLNCLTVRTDFIRIRIATYNVNDKLPPQGTRELAPLVGSGEEDLLVFGFQEVGACSEKFLALSPADIA